MRRGAFPLAVISAGIFIAACVDIPTGSNDILSIQFNPLPAPGVVVGDSLRDTLGVVRPVSVTAFNFTGAEIGNPPVRFSTIDRGIRVDSLTGIVTGDSVQSSSRIFATVGGLSVSTRIAVIPRPDLVTGSNTLDSLLYSLVDTANISNGLGVKVLHVTPADTTGVPSYLVSFAVISPADTALATLVGDAGGRSSLDTTDASGVATRRIRLDVSRLTSLEDSVVVRAFVRYRGVNLPGSPVRLVLRVKPK